MKFSFKHVVPLLIYAAFVMNPPIASAQGDSVISPVETPQKVVALTFDADMTPRMLHRLQSHKVSSWYEKRIIDELILQKVPATLFLTGMWVQTYPTTTKQLASNPLFEIGNHSYSHPAFHSPCYTLAPIPESDDTLQISKTDRLLSRYAPHHSMLFRFPGLCYDEDDLQAASNTGYAVIGGDVLGGDGFQKNFSAIVSNVVNHVHPGSIVVLHLMGGPNAPKTAEALHEIILALRKNGYSFATVSDLIKLSKK